MFAQTAKMLNFGPKLSFGQFNPQWRLRVCLNDIYVELWASEGHLGPKVPHSMQVEHRHPDLHPNTFQTRFWRLAIFKSSLMRNSYSVRKGRPWREDRVCVWPGTQVRTPTFEFESVFAF